MAGATSVKQNPCRTRRPSSAMALLDTELLTDGFMDSQACGAGAAIQVKGRPFDTGCRRSDAGITHGSVGWHVVGPPKPEGAAAVTSWSEVLLKGPAHALTLWSHRTVRAQAEVVRSSAP